MRNNQFRITKGVTFCTWQIYPYFTFLWIEWAWAHGLSPPAPHTSSLSLSLTPSPWHLTSWDNELLWRILLDYGVGAAAAGAGAGRLDMKFPLTSADLCAPWWVSRRKNLSDSSCAACGSPLIVYARLSPVPLNPLSKRPCPPKV